VAADAAVAGTVTQYTIPRDIRTVYQLWVLWKVGDRNMPSIQHLEHMFGAAWRPACEKTFFHRRKVIIDELERRAAAEPMRPEASIAVEMDLEHGGGSLDKLQKAIKEQWKKAEG
jgi:hypothetical protein